VRQLLTVLDQPLFHIGANEITLATLVSVAAVILLSYVISRLVERWFRRIAAGRDVQRAGSILVTGRLVKYAILIVGLAVAFDTLGIDLRALFAAGALLAIAIGFAMQNIAQNFVSGVILLFERSIKPGDIVEVDGRIMTIRELGIRSTIARALNEEDLIIPNSVLVQTTVKNYTLKDTLYRIDAPVGVVYSSDMHEVVETLMDAAAAIPWRSPDRVPVVLMTGFGSSSVDFMVSVWTDSPWDIRNRRSQVNKAIWWALKEKGITIAFPQLDVHFDSPVEEALGSLYNAEDQEGRT
jgi:potassium efflux system protein